MYTEELLQAHEEYSELLKSEIESKATILPKVREWHTLVADEEELERTANDPNRFKMRGGALLREEKLRKRVQILKPRVSSKTFLLDGPEADDLSRSRESFWGYCPNGRRKLGDHSWSLENALSMLSRMLLKRKRQLRKRKRYAFVSCS